MSRRIPETISEEELIRILKKVSDKKRKLAFMLGFYQCMRISEIVGFKPEHVDKGMRILKIKEAKGKKDRNIPIAPETLRGLRYLPVGVGIRALQVSFKNYTKGVLDRDLNFHCLRHRGATHYLNNKKWSTRQVQVFLGHSKIQTTEIYTHVTPKDLVNKMWDE